MFPVTYYLLPITYYLLPVTRYPFPVTCYLFLLPLPITGAVLYHGRRQTEMLHFLFFPSSS